ncbi:hypothetical protein [Bryobacter aggregatus]|uniref:hypothetical protein n=1 Tax=Bryobacter aggregatus TaxID=360054 RepID=UPI0012BAC6A8|nr:hypothetical protein [Bryobacter aggregatus]
MPKLSILLLLPLLAQAATIEFALNRMYNFDFNAADREMDRYIAEKPEDPLGYTFRSAAYLFRELDRLAILEGEFFASDKKFLDKKKPAPDLALKLRFRESLDLSRQKAQSLLNSDPNHRNALFALCLDAGLTSDYTALIEKRQLGSLSDARESQAYAVRLLKLDPDYADAYLTTGVTEYLLGSVPFFVRWFLHFDEVQGSKAVAVDRLKLVVKKGKYLGPFAKILLVIVHLREKRPQSAEILLSELSREFPENPLFQKELQKLRPTLKGTK